MLKRNHRRSQLGNEVKEKEKEARQKTSYLLLLIKTSLSIRKQVRDCILLAQIIILLLLLLAPKMNASGSFAFLL